MWPSKGMMTAEVKSECSANISSGKQSKKADCHNFNKIFVIIIVMFLRNKIKLLDYLMMRVNSNMVVCLCEDSICSGEYLL